MGHYLIQVAYTAEAWAAMMKNPQDRIEASRPIAENLGGKMLEGYVSFGEYDLLAICEFPDNVNAAAFSLAISSGGACKAVKTTPLMTIAQGVKAMKKAAKSGYEPPT